MHFSACLMDICDCWRCVVGAPHLCCTNTQLISLFVETFQSNFHIRVAEHSAVQWCTHQHMRQKGLFHLKWDSKDLLTLFKWQRFVELPVIYPILPESYPSLTRLASLVLIKGWGHTLFLDAIASQDSVSSVSHSVSHSVSQSQLLKYNQSYVLCIISH